LTVYEVHHRDRLKALDKLDVQLRQTQGTTEFEF